MSTFTDQLIAASDDLGSLSEHELSELLRRAAIRLDAAASEDDQVTLDPAVMSIVQKLSAGTNMTLTSTVNAILRDWLVGSGDMSENVVDEGTETKGSA